MMPPAELYYLSPSAIAVDPMAPALPMWIKVGWCAIVAIVAAAGCTLG